MIKQYYVLVDSEDREVNFYDLDFPDALASITDSAKQVEGSTIIHRKIDMNSKEKRDSVIWNYDEEVKTAK